MNRLPWHRSPPYGGLSDDGGTERLETDVMRFMAILAFCLVAIFALVQSISTTDPSAAPQTQAGPDAPAPAVGRRVAQPATPAVPAQAARAEPDDVAEAPLSTPPPREVVRPPPGRASATVAVAAPPVADVAPQPAIPPPATATRPRESPAPPAPAAESSPRSEPAEPAPPRRGFTLRFESGAALTQLVRSGEVDLFAFAGGDAWQLMLVGSRATFRTAQEPRQFHEMTPSTVPDDVLVSFRRSVIAASKPTTWGVTLPAATSAQLTRLMAVNDGGELVIDARGQLRLNR